VAPESKVTEPRGRAKNTANTIHVQHFVQRSHSTAVLQYCAVGVYWLSCPCRGISLQSEDKLLLLLCPSSGATIERCVFHQMFPRILQIPQAIHFLSAGFFRSPTNSASLCCCDRSVVHLCNISDVISMKDLFKLSFQTLNLFTLPLSLWASEWLTDGHFALLPNLPTALEVYHVKSVPVTTTWLFLRLRMEESARRCERCSENVK